MCLGNYLPLGDCGEPLLRDGAVSDPGPLLESFLQVLETLARAGVVLPQEDGGGHQRAG